MEDEEKIAFYFMRAQAEYHAELLGESVISLKVVLDLSPNYYGASLLCANALL